MSEAIRKEADDRYVIDADACVYCLLCVDECKRHLIYTHEDIQTPIKCDLCLECVKNCESGALSIVH